MTDLIFCRRETARPEELFRGGFFPCGQVFFVPGENRIEEKGFFMKPQIMPWEQVSRYIYNSGTLLVDLRDREEYSRDHITGAWNIPFEELEEHLSEMESFERVIFYCTSGNHSLAAARLLAKQGKQAYSVAGGYEEGIVKKQRR